ncbi:MAG TPA: hypothetical protein VHN81_03845, partial [Edaphobacter sp.]|nr:hypothetical protein [Edaphobacter sp.]
SGTTVGLSALNNGTTIATGVTPAGIAEENTKTYVLVVNNGGSSDLMAYTFDTTGKLAQKGTAATGTDPTQVSAIVAVP